MVLTQRKQEKLNRIGQQLASTEHMLSRHPLTQDNWGIVRTALHFLNLQTRWATADDVTKLLMGFQTALQANSTQESVTGFMGPHLTKCHEAIINLMAATLPKEAIGAKDFLSTSTKLLTIIMIFVTTQILGEWKGLFPKQDAVAAKKGGMLYQELGLIWLFGSQTIEQAFKTLANALKLDENSQKMISDIGVCYLLVLIMTITEERNQAREELIESLSPYMLKTLASIEKALEKAEGRSLIEEGITRAALSELQLVRRTLESRDLEGLPGAIQNAFQAFDISYEDIRMDLKQLEKFCNEVHNTFKNIYHQTEKSMTSMDQAA